MNSPRHRLAILATTLAALTAQAQTIFIDFGTNSTSTAGWNNVTSTGLSPSPVSLLDFDTKASSGVTYEITDAFHSLSTQTGAVSGEFPTTATNDFFFGQDSNPLAQITFSGLDPSKFYIFSYVSYRNTSGSDNRSTQFTLQGLGSSSVSTNSLNNLTSVSSIAIKPNSEGVFILDIAKGAANTNTSGFFYLNAMKIEVTQVPEPASAPVLAASAALVAAVGLRRRRRAA